MLDKDVTVNRSKQAEGVELFALLAGLICLVVLSRVIFISTPYYVDGPNHVAAVTSGDLFLQPPGYFLFNFVARTIYLTGLIGAASTVTLLNIGLSAFGSAIFCVLSIRLMPGMVGLLLAVFYSFSDTVWFVSDIHSTYAAMTFFAPAILYCIFVKERWWLVGPLWALMSGTRPSDGVFVLPCLLVLLVKKPIQTKIVFLLTALPVALLWYVPTVHHFGGHLMSPLSAAGTQVHKLANGLFVSGVSWRRKIGNLVHIALGALNAWNILTPFILIGLFTTARISRVVLLWCLPGFLFYVLYFFSDSTYLAFMIAPGLLAGGLILQQLSKKRASLVLACAIVFSVVQMIAMRPVSVTGAGTAILNAYSLKYSGWGLKHQYAARLADLIGFPE